MRPLFRYTVGPCLQQGLDILVESCRRTTAALGVDQFDWLICHNGLNQEHLHFLQAHVPPVFRFYQQNWRDAPIDDEQQSPQRADGSFEWNGNKCGGTLWKVSPPRLRMGGHEIIMDNDVVLLRKLPQIDQFLAAKNKVLLLEEPIRFYGRYDHLFPPGEALNSGFIGLPPGFDYGQHIRQTWEEQGRYSRISQADEQGLLTCVLRQQPNIRIAKNEIVEILARDYNQTIRGDEYGFHFTQSNKIPNHRAWQLYQQFIWS